MSPEHPDKAETLVDSDSAGKRERARQALLPIEMDQAAPWTGLLALIELPPVFSTYYVLF